MMQTPNWSFRRDRSEFSVIPVIVQWERKCVCVCVGGGGGGGLKCTATVCMH